jgi:predicted nuclease of predicted toxin-antitoxin system
VRILADENVPWPVVSALRAAGHDALAARDELRGADDHSVLERALAEDRLITFDKDFGELAYRFGLSAGSGIVLVRLSHTTPRRDNDRLLAALASRDDWAGHFSVIHDDRIRMRRLPAPTREGK